MFIANYSSFRPTHVPQPGAPGPICQGDEGPSHTVLVPFASLLLASSPMPAAAHTPATVHEGAGYLVGSPATARCREWEMGAKEAEDYGNMQETAKHTSCFQEAQQRGNTDSAPLC